MRIDAVAILSMTGDSNDRYKYKLLSTNKTSTMEKELNEVSNLNYKFVGITVAETAFGGNEVVIITRKRL